MADRLTEAQIERLRYKYAHVGCPAAHYEDNCAHPQRCAENGRCLDLTPAGRRVLPSVLAHRHLPEGFDADPQ